MDKRRSLHSTNSSPPSSPTLIPRLRAIQRMSAVFHIEIFGMWGLLVSSSSVSTYFITLSENLKTGNTGTILFTVMSWAKAPEQKPSDSCLNSRTLLVVHQWLCNNYEFLWKYFPVDPGVMPDKDGCRLTLWWLDGCRESSNNATT